MRGRDASFKARVVERVRAEVWPLVCSRRIVPRIQGVVSLAGLPDGLALLKARKAVGKVVCVNDR